KEAKLFEISRHAIIAELQKIAFADLSILLDKHGKMKPPEEWTKKMVDAVASFKIVHHYSGRGKSRKLQKTTFTVTMKENAKASRFPRNGPAPAETAWRGEWRASALGRPHEMAEADSVICRDY